MTEEEIKQAGKQYINCFHVPEAEKYARLCGFYAGAEANAPRWIPVGERLPEAVEGKMKPVLGLNGKHWVIVYYFPEHFKTVEWEDWDDYNQEDFPYTEEDNEKELVWLRPGFYQSVECEKCEGYWSPPLPLTHWMPLPLLPNQQP